MDADRGWCGGAGGCGHQLAGGLRVGGATQVLRGDAGAACVTTQSLGRSEEHTSELQSLMRISYAVFCLSKNEDLTLRIQSLLITYISLFGLKTPRQCTNS